MTQRTFSIIKPDAVGANNIGAIITKFEENGLQPVAMKMVSLTEDFVRKFYAHHADKPFFGEILEYMTSGPVIVQVLEGENAVEKNREVMGATNPKEAAAGTIRAEFAESIDANAVHGSDSVENAAEEIKIFFTEEEICPRG